MNKFYFLLLVLLFFSCSSSEGSRRGEDTISLFWRVVEEHGGEDFLESDTHLELMKNNNLIIENVDSIYCPFTFEDYNLSAYLFMPKNPRGTIFFSHGYGSYTFNYHRLINFLVNERYAVYAFDLPGHGLSSGERGGIKNFDEYGKAINAFIEKGKTLDLPTQWYAVGQSTGCSAFYEHASKNGSYFIKYFFASPLIRTTKYHLSKVGLFIIGPFVKDVGTPWKNELAVDRVPLSWFKELVKWNKNIKDYDKLSMDIIVIFSNKDKVVDVKYNSKFLESKIVDLKVKNIKEGSHNLFRDKSILNETFPMLLEFITN